MARKKSTTLTDAELKLMEVLWQKGRATVSTVVESLPKHEPLAYSTVLTTLRILEQKGYLEHTQEGRAYVYRPKIDREEERDKAITRLLGRFFHGSPELLMLNLVQRGKVSTQELKRLRKRIQEENS